MNKNRLNYSEEDLPVHMESIGKKYRKNITRNLASSGDKHVNSFRRLKKTILVSEKSYIGKAKGNSFSNISSNKKSRKGESRELKNHSVLSTADKIDNYLCRLKSGSKKTNRAVEYMIKQSLSSKRNEKQSLKRATSEKKIHEPANIKS